MGSDAATTTRAAVTRGRGWLFAALGYAVVAGATLWLAPLLSSDSIEGGSVQESLFQRGGWAAGAVLATPALVCATPLVVPARHRRPATVVAAVLAGGSVVLGAASVGLFYLPAAVLLVVAAVRMRAAA